MTVRDPTVDRMIVRLAFLKPRTLSAIRQHLANIHGQVRLIGPGKDEGIVLVDLPQLLQLLLYQPSEHEQYGRRGGVLSVVCTLQSCPAVGLLPLRVGLLPLVILICVADKLNFLKKKC